MTEGTWSEMEKKGSGVNQILHFVHMTVVRFTDDSLMICEYQGRPKLDFVALAFGRRADGAECSSDLKIYYMSRSLMQ